MVDGKKLTDGELRKQALLLESELNRLELSADYERLRGAFTGASHLFKPQESGGSWMTWLAPLAGLLLSGGVRRIFRGGIKEKLALVPQLFQLWRAFKKSSD